MSIEVCSKLRDRHIQEINIEVIKSIESNSPCILTKSEMEKPGICTMNFGTIFNLNILYSISVQYAHLLDVMCKQNCVSIHNTALTFIALRSFNAPLSLSKYCKYDVSEKSF